MSLADTFERSFKEKWYSGAIENIPRQERWECFNILLQQTISDKWWKGHPHENITPFPYLSKDIYEVKIGHDETIAKYCKEDPHYKWFHEKFPGKPDWRDMLENFAESVASKRKDEWEREFLKIYPKEKVVHTTSREEFEKTQQKIDNERQVFEEEKRELYEEKRKLYRDRKAFEKEKQELEKELAKYKGIVMNCQREIKAYGL